jgi:hypothetical protein
LDEEKRQAAERMPLERGENKKGLTHTSQTFNSTSEADHSL